jgi:hypothetical protein
MDEKKHLGRGVFGRNQESDRQQIPLPGRIISPHQDTLSRTFRIKILPRNRPLQLTTLQNLP